MYVYLPELTMNIAFIGFMTIATVIMIVQILMDVPVIQNMNKVMNICLDGDLANSHAFYSIIHFNNSVINYIFQDFDLGKVLLS